VAVFLHQREGLLLQLSRNRWGEPTKLSIHLGTFPVGDTEKAGGIFYEFSTMEIPRANGFSITTGISTLSCQVNGMNLDYSGPSKDRPLEPQRPQSPKMSAR